MEYTININAEEQKFLMDFAEKQAEGCRDNIGTMTPIHVVERRDVAFFPSEDGDTYNYDGHCEDSLDKLIQHINDQRPFPLPSYDSVYLTDVETADGEEIFITDATKYIEAYCPDVQVGFTVCSYRPVAFFLIRDEAVRYMTGYQAHNCANCRIFTYGLGYSNYGDLPCFRNLLMRLGTALLEGSK